MALLAALAWAGMARADGPGANGAAGPPDKDAVERVREKLAWHEQRARGWARMGYFGEAEREWIEADRVYQSVALRLVRPPDKVPVVGYLPDWHVSREIDLVRWHEAAWRGTVQRFALPARTLGDVRAYPYETQASPPMWSLVYTVAPEGLDRSRVAIDPASYQAANCIRGSTSFIATLTADAPPADLAAAGVRVVRTIDVPRGYTPYYLVPMGYKKQIAYLIGEPAPGEAPADANGVMVLYDGKVATLVDGPCAGPAIAAARGGGRMDALAADTAGSRLCALRKTETGAVIGTYMGSGEHCFDVVTFQGKDIVEHKHNLAPGWATQFSAADDKPITRIQAVEVMGYYYGLRHDLEGRRFALLGFWGAPHKIEFDAEKKEWRLAYAWGRPEISGRFATMVLDEKGRLLRIDTTEVPR
jgi:hypothetical protein